MSCELPDDTDGCSFAPSLMRCDWLGGGTAVCLGECTRAEATNCSNDCRPDEYAASCGVIGPGMPPAADPPPGCRNAQFNPVGNAFCCCPCQS